MGQRQDDRRALVAEVLEMGEQLFEMALGGRDTHEKVSGFEGHEKNEHGGEDRDYPVEEIRAAGDEFFTALRLLLEVDEG
jgi:hypothetical protein